VQAATNSHVFDDGTDYRELQQQGGPSYARPSWHPLLFRAPGSRSYEASIRSYYEDVWNEGCVELLDELAAPGVVYSDTMGLVEDAFGISGLQDVVQEFQASHPLLKVSVVSSSWLLLSCMYSEAHPCSVPGLLFLMQHLLQP
jgi:hypothetical protein